MRRGRAPHVRQRRRRRHRVRRPSSSSRGVAPEPRGSRRGGNRAARPRRTVRWRGPAPDRSQSSKRTARSWASCHSVERRSHEAKRTLCSCAVCERGEVGATVLDQQLAEIGADEHRAGQRSAVDLDLTQARVAEVGVGQVTVAQLCVAHVSAGHSRTGQYHTFKYAGIDPDARRLELGGRGVGRRAGSSPSRVECRDCLQFRRQVGRVWSHRQQVKDRVQQRIDVRAVCVRPAGQRRSRFRIGE